MKRLFTTMALSVLTITNSFFASSSLAQELAPSAAPVSQQASSVSAEQGVSQVAPLSGASLPTKSSAPAETLAPVVLQADPQAVPPVTAPATSGEAQTTAQGASQNTPGNLPASATVSGSLITYVDQWIRQPSSTSKNTAAYFKITNTSDKDVIIKEAIAEEGLCERIEIHGYKKEETEVKKMYKLETVTIPAKTTIEFVPGGLHVMLLGLKKPITKDSNISLILKILPADGNANEVIPDVALTLPVK